MKKIVFCILLALVIIPFVSFADNTTVPAPQDFGTNIQTIPDSDVAGTINTLTNWFFAIFLIVAVWFFIWAGFTFLTANGEPDKVTKARNQVMYGLIGVLVAVLAKGLVNFAMGLARKPTL